MTLMNTADGTRYTLILKPLGTGSSDGHGDRAAAAASPVRGGSAATTPTSTTVTLPPPTP